MLTLLVISLVGMVFALNVRVHNLHCELKEHIDGDYQEIVDELFDEIVEETLDDLDDI